MKFLDLFAGIGGFRLGMESAGHECVGFCEIDKFARNSYKAIHDTEGEVEMHDITTVSDEFIRGIGSVDVICGGFPCQAFSIAGKRKGFEDTRGTLFFEIARFASILRPRYLFLENVQDSLITKEGLRSRRFSEPWMNSGMMWNGKCLTLKTTFHKTGSEYSLSDILEENVPEKYFLSQEMTNRLLSYKDNKVQSIQSRQDMEKQRESDRTLLKVNSRNK